MRPFSIPFKAALHAINVFNFVWECFINLQINGSLAMKNEVFFIHHSVSLYMFFLPIEFYMRNQLWNLCCFPVLERFFLCLSCIFKQFESLWFCHFDLAFLVLFFSYISFGTLWASDSVISLLRLRNSKLLSLSLVILHLSFSLYFW